MSQKFLKLSLKDKSSPRSIWIASHGVLAVEPVTINNSMGTIVRTAVSWYRVNETSAQILKMLNVKS